MSLSQQQHKRTFYILFAFLFINTLSLSKTVTSNISASSSLRQRLLKGGVSYGPILMSDSPIVAELLAGVGYGHILVDHEHSPSDSSSGQVLLQAMDSAAAFTNFPRTEPIIRVPGHDSVYMKKILDSIRLPGGVMVPMVNDVVTAKEIVQSTRYPTQKTTQSSAGKASSIEGIRGCAIPFIRGSGYGMDPDYLRQCQEDLLVLVQVEDVKGVEAIPEIAAVDGIDGIFLGPFDLSTSVGKMGQFDDPEVQELVAHAERSVRSSPNCLLAGFRSPGRELLEMYQSGYSLVCGSVDLGLLKQAALNDFEAAQQAEQEIR